MSLRKLFFEAVPIVTCIIAWPVIILAERSATLCNLYYWFLFMFSKHLFHGTQEVIKRRMFRDLHAYRASLNEDIHVLEVGPGDGENFGHYPRKTRITIVEYKPFVEKRFSELLERYPTLILEKSIIGGAEDLKEVPNDSFDVVVGTHILCCVTDPAKAAAEVHRVLRPKGMFFTQEIVMHQHDENEKRKYQEWYAPFWSFFTLGCRAGNQEVYKLLRNAGFDVSLLRRYESPQLPSPVSLTHFGIAVKI